jgi:hypothetical protein
MIYVWLASMVAGTSFVGRTDRKLILSVRLLGALFQERLQVAFLNAPVATLAQLVALGLPAAQPPPHAFYITVEALRDLLDCEPSLRMVKAVNANFKWAVFV